MLEPAVRAADVIVAACGQPLVVKAEWVKEGAVVVDVGINSVETEHGKKVLCGDVELNEALLRRVTPVPGGVGPLTVTMLMENVLKSFENNRS
jgi:methylenetetrahydrofolate dehydrogenase (NADP+)/methenyltetrahydrofolate cyclohydrolase